MRSRIIRTALAAVLLVTGTVFGVSVFNGRLDPAKDEAKTDWYAALETCRPRADETEQERVRLCIQQTFRSAMMNGQALQAADEIARIAQVDYEFYGTCHLAIHALGREIAEYYNGADNAIKAINHLDCGTGLAHGVMAYWATLDPSDDEFASMAKACEQAMRLRHGGCPEGYGHAAYQHQEPGTADRFDAAIRLCNNFTEDPNQLMCAYGVIMQPFFHQDDQITEPEQPIPTWDDLVGLCANHRSGPVGVFVGCHAGAGWLMGIDVLRMYQDRELRPDFEPEKEARYFIDELIPDGLRACGFPSHDRSVVECSRQLLSRLPMFWYDAEHIEKRCSDLALRYRDAKAITAGLTRDIPVDPEQSFQLLLETRCIAAAFEFTPPEIMDQISARHPDVQRVLEDRVAKRL